MKTFTLLHEFPETQRASLWATVADFSELAKHHPLMKKVIELEPEAGGKRWCKVWEEAEIRPWLKMRPVYKIQTEVLEPSKRVAYRTKIMGLMRLTITITLGESNAQGRFEVEEQVQVTQLPIATKLFTQVFTPAHQNLFQTLRNNLKHSR